MIVYVDAAYSKKISGLGAVVLKRTRIHTGVGTTAPPSAAQSSIQAEACAVLFGLDVASSVISLSKAKKSPGLLILTDCLSVIDGIYDRDRRPESATRIIKRVVKDLNKAVENSILSWWRVEPVRREENLAHRVAVEARFKWTNRIRQR